MGEVKQNVEPKWMEIAKSYLGQQEIAGRQDNQFILDCFKYTGYKADHDEVPWCAAFVCRILDEAGYNHTRSAAAKSYLNYGEECFLKSGAIIVFRWAAGNRHVAFLHHIIDSNYVACLGGNQANMVKISVFSSKFIESIRWPIDLK